MAIVVRILAAAAAKRERGRATLLSTAVARVTHDLQQLAGDLSRARGSLTPRVGQVLRKVALDTERQVKDAMPVDTGRARASWGHWTPGDLRSGSEEASGADAAWEEAPLAITQGSNVPYIETLNAGHSRQAPAGFIDAAWLRGEQALAAALAVLLVQAGVGR